jgi:hypothetical protein
VSDNRLTPHFTVEDFTVTLHADLQEENRMVTTEERAKLAECAELAEVFMIALGCDLDIHSGRRFSKLNRRVGSSNKSQHLMNEAFDFSPKGPDSEKTILDAWHKLIAAAKAGKFKFGQLIVETQAGGREGRSFWIHASLGRPYRDPARCGEVFRMDDGKRTSPMVIIPQEVT